MNANKLLQLLEQHLAPNYLSATLAAGEVTLEVTADKYHQLMLTLVDSPFDFSQLIDLCAVDYQQYSGRAENSSGRYAVVSHLLSVLNNWRLRVRVFATDDSFPCVESINNIWASANWYEREAFDLFGVLFSGHEDLRRILTDYGFIGHPFRKDFPISGEVEVRYDPEQGRVIYQPVTIAERENVPRIVRN